MTAYVRYNDRYYICHASVEGDYEAQSFFSREETEAFLKKLQSQEHFEFEIPKDFKPAAKVKFSINENNKSYVKIKLKSYDYSYVVMMGTLIKGLNEHRFWAYDAMMSDEPYFRAAMKNIQAIVKSGEASTGKLGGHQYIQLRYNYSDNPKEAGYHIPAMKFHVRTIKGLFRRHERIGPKNRGQYGIWNAYLGTQEGVV